MCEAVMSESIIGRARKKGAIEMNFHQIREFAVNKHKFYKEVENEQTRLFGVFRKQCS